MLSVMSRRLSNGGTERHANSWQTDDPGQSPKGWHSANPLENYVLLYNMGFW